MTNATDVRFRNLYKSVSNCKGVGANCTARRLPPEVTVAPQVPDRAQVVIIGGGVVGASIA